MDMEAETCLGQAESESEIGGGSVEGAPPRADLPSEMVCIPTATWALFRDCPCLLVKNQMLSSPSKAAVSQLSLLVHGPTCSERGGDAPRAWE